MANIRIQINSDTVRLFECCSSSKLRPFELLKFEVSSVVLMADIIKRVVVKSNTLTYYLSSNYHSWRAMKANLASNYYEHGQYSYSYGHGQYSYYYEHGQYSYSKLKRKRFPRRQLGFTVLTTFWNKEKFDISFQYYSIITWYFSYWPSYRSEACCIGLWRSRTPIQQTEDL